MSDRVHVLFNDAQTLVAVDVAGVVRFERGDDGDLLWASQADGDWVVAFRTGERWRVRERPRLVELHRVEPLPAFIRDWATGEGIRSVGRLDGDLVYVVDMSFAAGGAR